MSYHPKSPRRVALIAVAVTGMLALPMAGTASAHVTVQAPGATQGGYTKLIFRAPTEKDVPTTKVEIAFPADQPIASVRVKAQPGWTYELTRGAPAKPLEAHGSPVTEVVQRITWTATDKGIGPEEFEEFEVSAGPLPKTDKLVFKTLQTYADGDVVRWIEEQAPGGEEPEHPAPSLELAAAADAPAAQPAAVTGAPAGNGASKALAGSALGASLLALVAAAVAIVRTRRRAS